MNILVCRTDKLGDFITALPTLYALKQHYKESKIIVCVAPLNVGLAKSCDFIDDCIVYDVKEPLFSFVKKIEAKKIDVSITLYSNTRLALAQFLARIPQRIAPATKIAQIFYTHRVVQRRSEVKMSEYEYNLELLKTLDSSISLDYKKPLLEYSDAKQVYEIFCINYEISREVVAFHMGSGGSSEANLTLNEYERLIRDTLRQRRFQVLLTFGPDEVELYEQMQVRFKDEDVLLYLSIDGLVYFAKLISQFRSFISTSTGTYHLASAVGTHTITFFGNSSFASASRWRAIGECENQVHYMIDNNKEEILQDVKKRLFFL